MMRISHSLFLYYTVWERGHDLITICAVGGRNGNATVSRLLSQYPRVCVYVLVCLCVVFVSCCGLGS